MTKTNRERGSQGNTPFIHIVSVRNLKSHGWPAACLSSRQPRCKICTRAKAMEVIMFHSAFQGHTRDKTLEHIPGLAQTCGVRAPQPSSHSSTLFKFFSPTDRCFKCLEYYSRYPGDQISSLPLNTNSWESDSLIAAVMVSPFVPRAIYVADIRIGVSLSWDAETPLTRFSANHPETGRLIRQYHVIEREFPWRTGNSIYLFL